MHKKNVYCVWLQTKNVFYNLIKSYATIEGSAIFSIDFCEAITIYDLETMCYLCYQAIFHKFVEVQYLITT
jgi:hypothetical protein